MHSNNLRLQTTYSLGYSKKGYITGEISRAYIEHFDEQTCKKANGRYRVLLVDGHVSHYSLEFIQEAFKRRIILLCYPSHMTHLLQGLDVIVFALLKREWERVRNEYETRTGLGVTKQTFLQVLAMAWLRVMTKELLRKAFVKTGVFPFNPNVISADKLSTSGATTTQTDAIMPFCPSTPVRLLTTRIRTNIDSSSFPPLPAPCFDDDARVDESTAEQLTDHLLHSSASFLLDNTRPLDLTATIPTLKMIPPQTPSRNPRRRAEDTAFECNVFGEDGDGNVTLLNRIAALESECQDLRRKVRTIHSHLALTYIHCERLRTQAEAKDEKEKSKKGGKKRLSTTKGALLSGIEFRTRAAEVREEQERQKDAKATKQVKMAAYKIERAKWESLDKDRVERNNVRRMRHQEALCEWESRGKPRGQKPKQVALEGADSIPKPLHPFPKKKSGGNACTDPLSMDIDGESSNESSSSGEE